MRHDRVQERKQKLAEKAVKDAAEAVVAKTTRPPKRGSLGTHSQGFRFNTYSGVGPWVGQRRA